jgi:putative glutamine amidotransferase
MTDQPVIGISSYAQQARWGRWDDAAVLLPRRYVDKVAQAGGLPVLLPPIEHIAAVLPRLDGLVLSGGSDVDPARYGAARHPAAGPFSGPRDSAELQMCRHALDTRLPLLGICRGLQVINVALGGTLHQHLPDLVGTDSHSPEESGYGQHKVSVAPQTQLAEILGRSEAAVPTHHHQAIDSLGAGLVATAWTDDGVIEAVEFDRAVAARKTVPVRNAVPAKNEVPAKNAVSFMIAVQWHPEAGDDVSLFTALVAAASGHAAAA